MLVTVIIIALVIITIITEIFWFSNHYRQEIGNNVEVAQAIGLAFEGLVRDVVHQEVAIGAAVRILSPEEPERIGEYLQSVEQPYFSVQSFLVVDSAGEIIASSLPDQPRFSVEDREYFRALRSGDSTVVSDFLRLRGTDTPGFVIGRGFYTEGVLDFAVLSLVQADRLGEITLRLRRGENEYFTLFDSKGVMMYTDQALDTLTFEERGWVDKDPLLARALRGEEAYGIFTAPVSENRRRIGARVPVSNLGWVSGAAVTLWGFFGPIIFYFASLLAATIIVAAVTLVLARRTVDTITRSFGNVRQHVRTVARGEFVTTEAKSGYLEFNDLLDDTNSMAVQLREREEKLLLFAAVVENSSDFIGMASPELVPFYVNEAGRRMVGLKEEQNISEIELVDFFWPEDRQFIQSKARPLLERGERWKEEVRLRNFSTGEPIDTIWSFFPIKDKSGQLLAWVTISPNLTPIKQASRALEESEERFRGAVEGLLDAFVIMSPIRDETGVLVDFRFEYANRVALEFAHMEKDEYVGRRASELFPPEVQTGVMPVYDRVLRSGEPAAIDAYQVKAPRGVYEKGVYIDIRASRLGGGIALAWRDVTSRTVAQMKLRESEERFRTLADNISQIAWMGDAEGWIFWYNKRWYDYTGTRFEDVEGWGWKNRIHPDHEQRIMKSIKHSYERGTFWEDTSPIRSRNGTYRWFLYRAVPIKDEDKKVVRWLGTATDITELRNLQEQLGDERELLQTIINSIPVMITLYDPQLDEIQINRAFEQITGWTQEDARGGRLLELVYPDPEYRASVAEYMRSLTPGFLDLKMRVKSGDTISTSWANVKLPDGRQVGIGIDVTARKELERQLKHRARELTALNKELESFSYSVAHDLRSPLRTMMGFGQFLKEDYGEKLDEEGREFIERIISSGQKMNNLIDDILNLSKITIQGISREDVDMSALARDIIDELRDADPGRRAEVEIGADLHAKADRKLIKVALKNLLGNAWKYTDKRDLAHIEFGSRKEGQERVFYVKDNGAGFDMARADKLFTPFKRLHADSEFPGTGVGLAIVDRVIRKHNGRVWAQGEMGKGATFLFTLGAES